MFPFVRMAVMAASLFAPDQAGSATPATPAAEEAAILEVIDRFMHAVSKSDDAAMAAIRIEGAMHTIARANGTVTRRAFQPRANATGPGTNQERYWDPVVHVRGSLAMVWTPYEFWVNGKTSHCGIDAFELVKQDGSWRIGNAMWTVEPDACPALRPSDPSRIRPKL
jgi:hypothetical protein